MNEIKRRQREEGLRFYKPFPYQEAFHRSNKPRRVVNGGIRAGKTMSIINDIVWRMTDTHPFHQNLPIPQYWRLCSAGMEEAVSKVLVEWCYKLIPREYLEGDDFNYSQKTHVLRFKNGGFMEFMSYDQEESKGAGRPLHGVFFDESRNCGERFRRQCLARLVDFGGVAIAGGCPEDGLTWEYEWYERAKNGHPDYGAYPFPTVENLTLAPEDIERMKDDLDHDEKLIRIYLYGDFLSIGGLVYPSLGTHIHRCTAAEFGVQPNWPIYVSIDPGISKAHAVAWAAIGPGGQKHFYRARKIGMETETQTMIELALGIRDVSRDERISGFTFDPHWDWNNRVVRSSDGTAPFNLEAELRKALDKVGYSNVPLLPARRDQRIWFGIDQVRSQLRIQSPFARPLITFGPDTDELWWEMTHYMCVTPKKNDPDRHAPRIRKVDDDFCDCVRILVTTDGVDYNAEVGGVSLPSLVSVDEYGLGF